MLWRVRKVQLNLQITGGDEVGHYMERNCVYVEVSLCSDSDIRPINREAGSDEATPKVKLLSRLLDQRLVQRGAFVLESNTAEIDTVRVCR